MELTDEEVENYLKDDSRLIIKLPIFVNNDFVADKISSAIDDLAKALGENEISVIVSSPPVLAHTLVESGKYSKSRMCEALIHKLHHDIMPYTSVIISVPKAAKAELIEICKNHGFLDALDIL